MRRLFAWLTLRKFWGLYILALVVLFIFAAKARAATIQDVHIFWTQPEFFENGDDLPPEFILATEAVVTLRTILVDGSVSEWTVPVSRQYCTAQGWYNGSTNKCVLGTKPPPGPCGIACHSSGATP